MIDSYGVRNFKSLKAMDFSFGGLNILAGLNSMGKSSVLQSLLMLRQSYFSDNSLKKMNVNGELVRLGGAKDVFNQDAFSDERLEFHVKDGGNEFRLSYLYADGDDFFHAENLRVDGRLSDCSLFNESFHYLGSSHIDPEPYYKSLSSDYSSLNTLGNNGQFFPLYLARHSEDEIQNDYLHHKNSKSFSLAHELDAWLGEISTGVRLYAQELVDLGISKVSVQYEVNRGSFHEMTNSYSLRNVGFGISFVIPLILNVLISKPGDILIIENPESNLHPQGQSCMGKLLALASASGIQVFCETHSDHVINGIRVSIKNMLIDNEKVKLFFLSKGNLPDSRMDPIVFDNKGELDNYPEGLLDEWGLLMSELI